MYTQKEKNWISEQEAAYLLELPETFFRNLVMKGSLKGVVQYFGTNNNSYQYCKADIENYIFEDSFFACL
jgi:hypothetical protein